MGLGQQELANYLNIKRSTLAMAEKNSRSLPTHAQLILIELLNNFTPEPADPNKVFALYRTQIQHSLQDRLQNNAFQLAKAIRERDSALSDLQALQQQTATLEKTLTQLQSTDPTPERDRKISWLQAQLTYTRTAALPELICHIALLNILVKGLEGEMVAFRI